jgi:hypothetical protein
MNDNNDIVPAPAGGGLEPIGGGRTWSADEGRQEGGRKGIIIFLLAALLVIAWVFFWPQAKGADLVHGVAPVSTRLQSIAPTIEEMARIQDPAERQAVLQRNWPHLQQDIIYYLRGDGKIQSNEQVARVEFRFGSLEGIQGESASREYQRGFVKDELIATIFVTGRDPFHVLVLCTNGMVAPLDDVQGLQLVGSHNVPMERFTIGRGKGLVHYVDYPLAIDLAERFRLPLYRGRDQRDANRITPAQARALENRTDWTQVTVGVKEGDVIDLRTGTYTSAT